MDPRFWGSQLPSSSEFTSVADWDFAVDGSLCQSFTDLLTHGMGGINNIEAGHSTFEEGGSSGSHQNAVWEYSTADCTREHGGNSGSYQNTFWEYSTADCTRAEGGSSSSNQNTFWEYSPAEVLPRDCIGEEGGNSGSHAIHWEYPTSDANLYAFKPGQLENAGIDTEEVLTNEMFEKLRVSLESVAQKTCEGSHRTPRRPYHTSRLTGWAFVKEVLHGRDERFYRIFKMRKEIFGELCTLLVTKYGWSSNGHNSICVEESLAIFICVLRGWVTDEIDDRFQRSRSTVHRHVHKILDCMTQFQRDEIAPNWSNDDAEIHPYLQCREEYKFFRNCIGAIDGTHVTSRPKPSEAHLFIGRKGVATTNIMAACDFDLCFTFAAVGWQGTWHDYAIFKEVVTNDAKYSFPHPPEGKCYLVDSGYANRTGYLAPYKGRKYHLPEFKRSKRKIREGEELFNRIHSSLRSAIERCFGVWKKRWRFLKNDPTFGNTQLYQTTRSKG